MTQEKFSHQMDRIKGKFGATNYKGETCNLMWHCFKHYPDFFMEKAVTKFILDYRQSPTRKDFEHEFKLMEQSEGSIDNPYYEEPWSEVNISCDRCFKYYKLICKGSQLADDNFKRLCPDCRGGK